MGYQACKLKDSWFLKHKVDHGKGKKPDERRVPDGSDEFKALGLRREMTLVEARKQLDVHRAVNKVDRERQRKEIGARRRLSHKALLVSAWLPQDWVSEFEATLTNKGIKPVAWEAAKHLIVDVNLPPSDWEYKSEALHLWIAGRAYSKDYAGRIWFALNQYQKFYHYKKGAPRSEMPAISPLGWKEIKRAYHSRVKGKYEASLMGVEQLEILKKTLPTPKHNWVAVAFWFGLRPREMDQLKTPTNDKSWFLDNKDPRFKGVLHLHQEKLEEQGEPERHRWKNIPAVEPEQIALLEVIRDGNFERPGIKSVRTALKDPRWKYKSPRRSFATILEHRGYDRHVINWWLGHVSKELKVMVLHYDNHLYVEYKPKG